MRIIKVPTMSAIGEVLFSTNNISLSLKEAPLQKVIRSNKVQTQIKIEIDNRKVAEANLARYINVVENVIRYTRKSEHISMLNIILADAKAKKEMLSKLVEYEVIPADSYESLPVDQKMEISRLNGHVSNQNLWRHVQGDEDILAYIKVPTLHTKDGEYDVYITWFLITTGTTDNLARPRLNRGRVVANG